MNDVTKMTDTEDVFDAFIQGWVPQDKWDDAFKYAQSMLRHRPLVLASKLAEVEQERDELMRIIRLFHECSDPPSDGHMAPGYAEAAAFARKLDSNAAVDSHPAVKERA